jgi:5,10-methylenetetrahydromethanopterin reductase
MDISCAFATSLDTPDHIVLAEQLGYRRAWCYDSPALYPDVWMTLTRAAERTHRIQLAPGVLVPSLRHVLVNAAAIATLVALAPARVAVGVGAGFTGRLALGQRPLRWRDIAAYLQTLRVLLRGEEVEWEGAVLHMLHPAGFAPPRPIEISFIVAAEGPKGRAVARDLGTGLLTARPQGGFPWGAQILVGTVLDQGEDPGSERVLAAAGHAAAVFYHLTYDAGHGWGDLDTLPNGDAWRRRAEAIPKRTRHLTMHAGHLVTMNELDRGVITGATLAALGVALEVPAWQARLAESARAGATEIIYQPAGPDIQRELTVFAKMAGL